MKFGEFRKYVSRIDRVSICMSETQQYRNFQFIREVPESYNDCYLFGVGRIQSEFPICQAIDEAVKMHYEISDRTMNEIIYAECIEIMLSETERDFDSEEPTVITFKNPEE
ncbi:MAG: hypothetical protein K6B74_13380 [Ruminococcus sp.]|nr:hypothetical protein [Ruminococcus sp.]